MRINLLVCFLSIAMAACSGQEVLYQLEGSVVQKDFLIQPNDFSSAYVLKLSNSFLHETRNASLAKLTIYTQKPLAFLLRSGKGVTDYSYEFWRSEYSELLPKLSAMAELVKVKDHATLRIRDAEGRVEEIALNGDNVFHGRVNGTEYDLLEVTFRKTLPNSATPRVSVNFSIALRQTLSFDSALAIAKCIEGQVGMPDVAIVIRNDRWFVDDQSYPWINPFVPVAQLPTWDQYKDSFSYYCSSKSNQTKCTRMSILVAEGGDQ
jgi:hypothetical protein